MSFTLYATRLFDHDLEDIRGNSALHGKLDKTFRYLEDDPRRHQGSLRTEALQRMRKTGYELLKSRVDDYFRIAWRYDGAGAIVLLRIGKKFLIDQYATFNESEIVRRVSTREEEIREPDAQRDVEVSRQYAPPGECLFQRWHSTHLELLGVPSDKVRGVKLVTEIDEIHELGLPECAAQNLTDAYLLEDWTVANLFDGSSIFYRTNADRLEGYCKGEIKQLMLNLSPEQERLVNLQTTGPTLIKGVAGSGKTTVGAYRAMAQTHLKTLFQQHSDPRVLFLTYTETLARVVEQMFEEIYGKDEAKRVEVWVLRDWLKTYLESQPGTRQVGFSSELDYAVVQGMSGAKRRFPNNALANFGSYPGEFFKSEIDDVIKGRNLRTWQEYAQARRVGRGQALAEPGRRFVWAVYEGYCDQLDRVDKFDYTDLAIHALDCIENDPDYPRYDAVIVDEAQDLRPVQLQVVSLLAGGAKARNLVLLADPAQSIYYRGIPWKDGNIQIAGARSFTLSRNYRNTQEILAAAWSLAQNQTLDDPDEEVISPDVTDRRGPRPKVVYCQDSDFHDRFVVEEIKELCNRMAFRPGDIAVLARTNDGVKHMKEILKRADLPAVHFRDDKFDIFENHIKVVTINSAKGLEFPVVFLTGLHEGELPRRLSQGNPEELQAGLRTERRLMYVGMTRAANRLYLVCRQDDKSRFVDEIDPATVRFDHCRHVPEESEIPF